MDAENKEMPQSKREVMLARLKTKYPDREWADDEALMGQIQEDYDDYESQINHMRENEGKFTDMIADQPMAAQFVADMAAGRSPWVSLVEHVGADGVMALMNDPERKAELEEADRKYVERLAEEKRLDEEYSKNIEASQALRDEMTAKYGEETVDAVIDVIDQISKDALLGKITPATFDMALKVVKHDSEVENAREEGEIAGRNAKIEEKLMKPKAGDGLPGMGGESAAKAAPKVRRSIFDDARGEN